MTDKEMILREAFQIGDELHVELQYPRTDEPEKVRSFVVGLCDVRAADDIRVSYDFERDGWKIEQASRFTFNVDEEVNPDWQEVAFIQAWARQTDSTEP